MEVDWSCSNSNFCTLPWKRPFSSMEVDVFNMKVGGSSMKYRNLPWKYTQNQTNVGDPVNGRGRRMYEPQATTKSGQQPRNRAFASVWCPGGVPRAKRFSFADRLVESLVASWGGCFVGGKCCSKQTHVVHDTTTVRETYSS